MPESTKQPDQYSGVIFDCDGTLTDSMETHYIAWQKTMDAHGIKFDRTKFYELGGMPTDKIIRLLSQEAGKSVDIETASAQKEQSFLTLLDQVGPLQAVVDIAANLRGKIPIAVASGGFRDSILAQLKQIDCEDWFDAIVTAEDTTKHKPEPDVFLEAACRLKVDPKNCLVFEDSDLGIAAAQAADMDWVDVRKM